MRLMLTSLPSQNKIYIILNSTLWCSILCLCMQKHTNYNNNKKKKGLSGLRE